MSLACRISGHKWFKLPDGSDGCTCERCGESHFAHGFNYSHNWVKEPGSCKATCTWCGREETRHDWNKCLCTWCGATCDDHSWEPIPGTCEFRCTVCGKVSLYKKDHLWQGCTCTRCGEVRNAGHRFVAPAEGGLAVCAICGMSIDESRAQNIIDVVKKARGDLRRCRGVEEVVKEMTDPDALLKVVGSVPLQALRRLGHLGADKALAKLAKDPSSGYQLRVDARNLIRDEALRESITVCRTEDEQRWYDYDIKSGM